MSRCLLFPRDNVIENSNNLKSNFRDVPEWRVYRVFPKHIQGKNLLSGQKTAGSKCRQNDQDVCIISHQLTAV